MKKKQIFILHLLKKKNDKLSVAYQPIKGKRWKISESLFDFVKNLLTSTNFSYSCCTQNSTCSGNFNHSTDNEKYSVLFSRQKLNLIGLYDCSNVFKGKQKISLNQMVYLWCPVWRSHLQPSNFIFKDHKLSGGKQQFNSVEILLPTVFFFFFF